MMGMMGAIGMGDWKMESAKPMSMGGGGATVPITTAVYSGGSAERTGAARRSRVGDLLVDCVPRQRATTKVDSTIRFASAMPRGNRVTGAKVSSTTPWTCLACASSSAEAKEVGNGLYQGTARSRWAVPWGLGRPDRAPREAGCTREVHRPRERLKRAGSR